MLRGQVGKRYPEGMANVCAWECCRWEAELGGGCVGVRLMESVGMGRRAGGIGLEEADR